MKTRSFSQVVSPTNWVVVLSFASMGVLAQPANDMFLNRTVVSGGNITAYGNNWNATKELSEPNHGGKSGGASVWWSWRAPAAGNVQIVTSGSSLDTLLGVYVGSTVSTLSEVASNDDDLDAGDLSSKVLFSAVSGQVYQIAVDGFLGDMGTITLKVQQPPLAPPPPPPAPAWQLPDPYGRLIRSTDYSGKVVMLNFWGTTCGPCLAEMPDMVALQGKYRSDGFEIIGADVSWWRDAPQTVANFLATFTPTINYQVVMSTAANEAAFGGISAVPTTFIIDRQNLIRKKFVGSQSEATFEAQILPLLYGDTRLRCDLTGTQPVLRWPVTATPFVLESATTLNSPSWSPWPNQPVAVNGTNTVQVSMPGNRFFRLRMPY